MSSKLKLSSKYVGRTLKALDIEVKKKRLPNDLGTAFHLKDGPCCGVVVTAYDTGTVTVQGRGENGDREVFLIRELLEDAAAVVTECFD